MRSFEELKSIFDILATCNEPVSLETDKMLLVRFKWITAIAGKLYPGTVKGSFDAFVNDYGEFMYEGLGMETEDLIYLYETSLLQGNLDSYVLYYMNQSPLWDFRISYLGIDDYASKMPFLSFMKCSFDEFFEEKLYNMEEEGHVLRPVYDMFDKDNEPMDDVCIIKSSLYPYVEKLKGIVSGEHAEYIAYLERAYKVISDWMFGEDYHFATDKYGYFACCDASSFASCYGASGGAIDLKVAIIICAELIERAMFDLNEIYHFLPNQLSALLGRRDL